MTVELSTIADQIRSYGTVKVQDLVSVSPQVSNRLTKIYVDLGMKPMDAIITTTKILAEPGIVLHLLPFLASRFIKSHHFREDYRIEALVEIMAKMSGIQWSSPALTKILKLFHQSQVDFDNTLHL